MASCYVMAFSRQLTFQELHYTDLVNKTHGYQAKGSRKYTTIDFPGATYTEAHGINDSKEIVGMYRDASNKTHGFLLSTQ